MADRVALKDGKINDVQDSIEAVGLFNKKGELIDPAIATIPDHDFTGLTYTGADLTGVVYKMGGASGTIVASLTLGYSGGNLISVTKN